MGIGIDPTYERNGKNRLWKNLTIPYEIDCTFVCNSKERLLAMINEWNDSRMVIKYKPRNGEDDYVSFTETADGGGSSYVGCIKEGMQLIEMDLDAKGNDTILHEMGHAAGLSHEHKRCDRNSYIKMDHTLFNHPYDAGDDDNSGVDWNELTDQYNERYGTDIDNDKMKDVIHRYGIIPENSIKYRIYTCYDYRSIMHYKTLERKELRGTKFDTIRSYPEIFGGYNYVENSQFSSSRNYQTARNGLSFNDIYTIWRIYIADCPVPPRHCTYARPQISDLHYLDLH